MLRLRIKEGMPPHPHMPLQYAQEQLYILTNSVSLNIRALFSCSNYRCFVPLHLAVLIQQDSAVLEFSIFSISFHIHRAAV
jgi:hypothetical protein